MKGNNTDRGCPLVCIKGKNLLRIPHLLFWFKASIELWGLCLILTEFIDASNLKPKIKLLFQPVWPTLNLLTLNLADPVIDQFYNYPVVQ